MHTRQSRPLAAGVVVAYSPTQANRLFISKAMPLLGNCGFEELPAGRGERLAALADLRKRRNIMFLWGDGEKHDESHFFTMRPVPEGSRRLKINLDPHCDEYVSQDDGGDIDFTNMEPRRSSPDCLDCSNHMTHTKDTGVEIFTCATSASRTIAGECISAFCDLLVQKFTGGGMIRFLRAAIAKAASFEGEVDATLDEDLVRGLPVIQRFLSWHDSIPASRILDALPALLARASMFDMGGMVERIPDFSLDADVNLGRPPSSREVGGFVASHPDAPVGQGTIDRVCSYATMFRVRAISIFEKSKE